MHRTEKRWSIYVWTCLVIILGFIAVAVSNNMAVSKIVDEDLQKNTKLMVSNIYSVIQNELGKPTIVANTMASDTYLVQWLREERSGNRSNTHRGELGAYLSIMRDKYSYGSSYLISADSSTYYYPDGTSRVLDRREDASRWYFDFVGSGKESQLIIQRDEQNSGALSVFISARVEDSEGNLMGVTGISLPIEWFQTLLGEYEKQYEMKICMVNSTGYIEVEADQKIITMDSVFERWKLDEELRDGLMQKGENNTGSYVLAGSEYYVVSLYIEELDWYLFIQEENTSSDTLKQLTDQNFIIIGILLVVLLGINTRLIYRENKRMERRLGVDALTGIPSRNYFFTSILLKEELAGNKEQYLILFDIDHFKQVNDIRGHNAGDEVLKLVADTAKDKISPFGELVRWGGDEFIAIVTAGKKDIETIFMGIQERMRQEEITVSMGVVKYEKDVDILSLIDGADKAMYESKKKGRDVLTFFED